MVEQQAIGSCCSSSKGEFNIQSPTNVTYRILWHWGKGEFYKIRKYETITLFVLETQKPLGISGVNINAWSCTLEHLTKSSECNKQFSGALLFYRDLYMQLCNIYQILSSYSKQLPAMFFRIPTGCKDIYTGAYKTNHRTKKVLWTISLSLDHTTKMHKIKVQYVWG